VKVEFKNKTLIKIVHIILRLLFLEQSDIVSTNHTTCKYVLRWH